MLLPELIDLLGRARNGGGFSAYDIGPGLQAVPKLSEKQQSCMSYAMSQTTDPRQIQRLFAKCERGDLDI